MAYSFNGIGTEYHGRRDIREDGSYITTKFFCIFAPLIPLGSYRVTEAGQKEIYLGGERQRYMHVERVELNVRQVLNVYLAIAAVVVAVLLVIWFFNRR